MFITFTLKRTQGGLLIKTIINDLSIHSVSEGKGPPILFLHGWGGSHKIFNQLIKKYSSEYSIYALDFPGFGDSNEPREAWGTEEYCKMVIEYLDKMKIVEPIIIAHSFGGRIAIRLAQKINIKKLLLTGSAGVKPKRKLAYYVKVYSYKTLKHVMNILDKVSPGISNVIRSKFGSEDYKKSSPIMRKILVKVVNEDLTSLLSLITCPTLLIWGENDQDTPLYQARVMENHIPNSGLVIIKGAGHHAFIDNPQYFSIVTSNFIGGK